MFVYVYMFVQALFFFQGLTNVFALHVIVEGDAVWDSSFGALA